MTEVKTSFLHETFVYFQTFKRTAFNIYPYGTAEGTFFFRIVIRIETETRKLERKSKQQISRLIDLFRGSTDPDSFSFDILFLSCIKPRSRCHDFEADFPRQIMDMLVVAQGLVAIFLLFIIFHIIYDNTIKGAVDKK